MVSNCTNGRTGFREVDLNLAEQGAKSVRALAHGSNLIATNHRRHSRVIRFDKPGEDVPKFSRWKNHLAHRSQNRV